ncbi:MAG: hypothetical protein KGI52_14070 [Burkholderiales bacterium]|nr:hypothetical protein [Burkholderiales bacterium]
MKKYNGHRSWNAWNVALWLFNDEGLYGIVQRNQAERPHDPRAAAQGVLRELHADGIRRTPDGAVFNLLCIRLAIDE